MPATNKPNKRLFKGEHEFFKEGIPYTYRQFVEWTEEFTPPGVNGQTMKGRLGKEPYCLPAGASSFCRCLYCHALRVEKKGE